MSENDLFWQAGLTSFAIRNHCIYTEDRARFMELKSHHVTSLLLEWSKEVKSGAKSYDSFQSVAEACAASDDERRRILTAAEQRVIQTMSIGRLSAFGFQAPRKITDTPHDLTAFAVKGRIDWDKGTLDYQSMKFVDLAFIYDDQIDAIRDKSIQYENPEAPPKRGRPAKKDKIVAVVEEMMADGSFDPNRTRTSQYDFIRSRLAQRFPELTEKEKNPAGETIRRAILTLIGDPDIKQ